MTTFLVLLLGHVTVGTCSWFAARSYYRKQPRVEYVSRAGGHSYNDGEVVVYADHGEVSAFHTPVGLLITYKRYKT